ncbi:hypothetical protein EDD15DRAFT_2522432 [Pisolithus albus]|nr:hypothetical protein EDD15DRAFT_2522432 [Pisolithus albus]
MRPVWVVGDLPLLLQLLALLGQWSPQLKGLWQRPEGIWPEPLRMLLVVDVPQQAAVGLVLMMTGLVSGLYMTASSGGGSQLVVGKVSELAAGGPDPEEPSAGGSCNPKC